MVDLSHWDFAENFSGYDAAALILGVEPRESQGDQWRVNVVMDRMALHYKQACQNAFHHTFGDPVDADAGHPIVLSSVHLDQLQRRSFLHDEEVPLSDWLGSPYDSKFEYQEFGRLSIDRWLSAIGMKSVYSFCKSVSDTTLTMAGRWPWGNHHTELLGHLDAAARRYWGAGYDPADTGTASTNATVSEWLQTERKVSRTMADAIASMLRPDGLPTGPRK